ncbi:EAL domain-containing protein [Roseateles sp.]|uniref:EAL domain-containing protein n=1 Tax=Roseateles sp. TaxID=1971397 RepID=UPI00286D43CA|nr:EAL domain-containing protein [Roseateles sp.]
MSSSLGEDAQSPRWSFGQGSDVLTLNQDIGAGSTCLKLAPEQAQQLRALGAATACIRVTIRAAQCIELVLIGKKTGVGLWGGLANRADDVDGIIAAMQKALGFAEQIVSEVNSLVLVVDRNYKVRRFNRLCEEGTGMQEADMIGVDAHKLFLAAAHQHEARANIAEFFEKEASFETVRPIHTQQGLRQIHWRNKLVRGGSDEDTYLVCSGVDITDALANQQRLYELATQDRITGLPNGYASRQRLDAAIESGCPATIMTLGFLNYRSLRGMLGITQSEGLMKQAAEAVVRAVPPDWTVSRLGGPEFRLHAEGAREDAELAAVSGKILQELAQNFVVAGVQIRLHAAIGAARIPEHAATADDLEMAVDAAMHSAMMRAGNSFQLYHSRLRDALAEGLWLDAQMHEALDRNELDLWFQPKVDLLDGQVNSVEALIRWKHPELGYIPPDKFIPRAETTGLIVRIGRWVVQTAAQQAAAWAAEGRPLRVSVNVSAKQLVHDASLTQILKAAQDRCGGLIDVELTESSFLEDAQAARVFIECCRSLGCGVHLDDFGSGYSSLGQLADLELTAVKLDRTFIAEGGNSPRQHAMLEAISRLAQALGLDVIAEGIETEAMALKLRSIGVQYGQGWLYSKAVPAKELLAWLGARDASAQPC